MGDVVAVADKSDLLAGQAPAVLADGHQVGDDLAGVGAVGERVHDRDRGGLSHLQQVGVAVQAGYDPAGVALQDAGPVSECLPAAELDVPLAERGPGSAQSGDAGLERGPCPQRRLFEDQGDVLAVQGQLPEAAITYQPAELEHRRELVAGQVGDIEKVAAS